jgi:ABC-type nitrate/sulfonate/bicarbonate transport system substrate-binding protein
VGTVKDYFPSYQWGIVLAHEHLLRNEPDLVQAALAAYRDACRALQAQPDQAAGFGAQVFGVKKAVFRRALERGLPGWELDGRLDTDGIRNCIRIQRQTGGLKSALEPEQLVWPEAQRT